MMPAPARYATTLDPRCRTLGPRIAAVSAALTEPFMPWQAQAADLIGAIHPDDPTRWRYPLVVITVPRQAGKSTLLRAVHLDRLIRPNPDRRPPRRPQTIWMTAQTGKDARKRWADLANLVQTSEVFRSVVTKRASIGSEGLRFGPMMLSPFAPTPKSLHGDTTPFVSIDEAWAFDEPAAAALLAAVTPTMQNEPGKQLLIVSTAGNTASKWLWSLVRAGRESLSDPASEMAYLEWSAPDDADPYDPATFDSFHPAVGHIISAQDVLALRATAGSLANWRRGFLNSWPDGMDTTRRSLDSFDAQAAPNLTAPDNPTYAYAVAADRSCSSIWAAWPTPTGVHVALVMTGTGAAWISDALHTLNPGRLYADTVGYTANAAEQLHRDHKIKTTPVTTQQLAAAASGWIAGLEDGTLTHDGSTELRDAYELAPTRSLAGGFVFDDRHAQGPICDLIAASVAAQHAHRAASTPGVYW